MATLRYRRDVPPCGWKYYQQESKLLINGENFEDLRRLVIAHRRHKGYAPTDEETVGLEIERQICTRLGNYQCRSEGPNDDWVPMPDDGDFLSLEKIKSASAAAWEWFKRGGELVPLAEAERRARICEGCPCNEPFSGCKACGIQKLISQVVPEERRFEWLNGCLVCGCDLKSKVNMPNSVIVASDRGRNLRYPVGHCWQREILEANKTLP